MLFKKLRTRCQNKIDASSVAGIEISYSSLFSEMGEALAVYEIILDGQDHPIDYRFLAVNPAFTLMTGLQASQVLGRTMRQISSAGEAEEVERYGRIALRGGSERFESWSVGLARWLDVNAFAAGPLRFATILVDITERKKTEDALKADEARLQGLVRLLQHPVCSEQALFDAALAEAMSMTSSECGCIFRYDEDLREFALHARSGKARAECGVLDERTLYRLEGTGFWGEAVRQRRAIVENDFTLPSPNKKNLPGGHAGLVRFLSVPVFLSEKIVGVVGVANKAEPYDKADARQLELLITPVFSQVERIRAMGLVSENESRFRAMTTAMDDIVFTMDTSGILTGVYGSWPERFGLVGESCIGKTLSEVFGPDVTEAHEAASARVLGGAGATYEWTASGFGEREPCVMQTSLSPIRVDGKVSEIVAVGRDVTAHVKRERRFERLVNEKLALIREVQHRVKNNLQMIISLMELQATFGSDGWNLARIKLMQSRIYSIASVHDLLGGSGSFDTISLLESLRNLVSFIQAHDDGSYDIDVSGDERLFLTVDVAVPVSLIVHELLVNCIGHARKENGLLSVNISAVTEDGSVCEIRVVDDGDQLEAGSGPVSKGGMGSMLIKGLAEQIKGSVAVDRIKGYEVVLRFPVSGAGRPKYPSDPSELEFVEFANDQGIA
ncbi:MAG TPA: hypothetical protein DIC34_02465 [Treponema sp.]|nr:hypothetical protein [Treponema sp.]